MDNENSPRDASPLHERGFVLRFRSRPEVIKGLSMLILKRIAIFCIAAAGVTGYLFLKEMYPRGMSNNYAPDKFNVIFTDAVPRIYQNGRATSCILKADIQNGSKHHFTQMNFKIGEWQFSEENFSANSKIDGQDIFTVDLSERGTCAEQAEFIMKSVSKAEVFDCSIPNVPEGDCQQLVTISTNLNAAKVAMIALTDLALSQKQLAPLQAALSEAGLSRDHFGPFDGAKSSAYAKLLDMIVSIDSSSWQFNVYKPGSMRSVSLVDQTQDGSSVTLVGSYDYDGIGGPSGWVKVKIPKQGMPCLVYHDSRQSCRPIVFPDVSIDE